MIPLPEWAKTYFNDSPCPYCKADKRPEWVCGVGIREVKKLGQTATQQKGNAGLSFEYMCPCCGRHSTTIIDPNDPSISANDIAKEISGIFVSQPSESAQPKNRVAKTKPVGISDKEVSDFKNNLKTMSHDDFMRYIGVPSEQITKYKDKKDGKSG